MIIWTLLTSFCRRVAQIGFGIHSEHSKRRYKLNLGDRLSYVEAKAMAKLN